MLVLSRKRNERVLFPGTQTAVEVVSIPAGVVRLGIDAPAEVKVVRGELHDRAQAGTAATVTLTGQPTGGLPRELAHLLRNRLHAATLAVAVLRRQQQLGLVGDAQATTEKLSQEIQALRQHLEGLSPQAPVGGPQAAPPRRRRALLVEDDTNERELLAGFLRLAGLEVATAADGVEALDRLHAQELPDVVLLDMVLPRCDGPATGREIRRDPARAALKVFAVTGRS